MDDGLRGGRDRHRRRTPGLRPDLAVRVRGDRQPTPRGERGPAHDYDADHGGIESLGGFLAMFALNLADVPDARRALLADRALIPDAIDESLRSTRPPQRFRRRLTVDMEMHGRTIRPVTTSAWPMARPIATRGSFLTPTSTTSAAGRAVTWGSAAEYTPASARWWRGWPCVSCSRSGCRESRSSHASSATSRGCRQRHFAAQYDCASPDADGSSRHAAWPAPTSKLP